MNKLDAVFYSLIALMLTSMAVGQLFTAHTEASTSKHDYVYAICNQARTQLSGASEQQCGEAQDRTSTEFMCEHNNSLTSTHCWVESK